MRFYSIGYKETDRRVPVDEIAANLRLSLARSRYCEGAGGKVAADAGGTEGGTGAGAADAGEVEVAADAGTAGVTGADAVVAGVGACRAGAVGGATGTFGMRVIAFAISDSVAPQPEQLLALAGFKAPQSGQATSGCLCGSSAPHATQYSTFGRFILLQDGHLFA
jgi:hypothetical protein